MPKGENQKAVEARARKAEAAAKKAAEASVKKDEEAWRDDDKQINRKMNRAAEAEKKEAEKIAKKQELREIYEQEQAALASNKKGPAAPKKVPQAEIQRRLLIAKMAEQKAKEEEAAAASSYLGDVTENTNQVMRRQISDAAERGEDLVIAKGLAAAVSVLDSSDPAVDRNPEKRVGAAYRAYEEQWIPLMKAEFPSLKRSQWVDKIRKQWQKAPENPFNQGAK
eukprot:GDKH01026559.1.p1 GENE.GDKH01026559.1~~GDKH01026559.1.p1  ORF type:complete len:224 (-),score=64.99 GDKH01026559.1:375-1046(-)